MSCSTCNLSPGSSSALVQISDSVSLPTSTSPLALCNAELYEQFKDAVVEMNIIPRYALSLATETSGVGVAQLLTFTAATGQTALTVPVAGLAQNAVPAMPIKYTGFLNEKGYIISSSSFLYTFVLAMYYTLIYINSSLSATSTTIPTTSLLSPSGPGYLPSVFQVLAAIFNVLATQTSPTLMNFFQFFVTLYNLNGCGKALVYRASIAGADLDTGIAVFTISKCDPWNECCPEIKSYKGLSFGSSTCTKPGSPVSVITSQYQQSPLGMASGTVVSNHDIIANGTITYESILTDVSVMEGSVGAPILNQCGLVVGIVTGHNGVIRRADVIEPYLDVLGGSTPGITVALRGSAFGVASDFIKRVVCAITDNYERPQCEPCYVVYNPILGLNVYRHAALGIRYYYRTGAEIAMFEGDAIYPGNAERWYDPNYCRMNREVIGIVVQQVTGALASAYEQCTTQQFPSYSARSGNATDINFQGYQIEPFDVIVAINGTSIGQLLPLQSSPEQILYKLNGCDTATITFLKASEQYSQCHQLCTALDDSIAFMFVQLPALAPIFPDPTVTTTLSIATVLSILSPYFVYFLMLVPQVERTYFIAQLCSAPLSQRNIVGIALLASLAAGTTSIYQDPAGLLKVIQGLTIAPALSLDLNYLNTITTNQLFSTQLQSQLPL